MRIIEVGDAHKTEYEQSCSNCRTKFAFKIGEVNSGNIRCPHCSSILEARLNKPIKRRLND